MISQNEQKILVAQTAVDELMNDGLIFSGMKIGLGTGSTAMPAVHRLGEKLSSGELRNIMAVPTSFQTLLECEKLHIPVYELNSPQINGELDLAIDGADEVSPEKHLIKGGGAALLQEKIIAYNAKKFVVIADETKFVKNLGTKFPLPIEIVSPGRVAVIHALEKLGATCQIRYGVKKAGPVVTDNGNLIVDALWKNPVNAAMLEEEINKIVGVVENGFFTKNIPIVFGVGGDGKVFRQ